MNRLIPGLSLAACWLLLLLYGSSHLFSLVTFLILGIGATEYRKMAFPENDTLLRIFFPVLILLPLSFIVFLPHVGVSGGLLLSFLLLTGFVLYRYHCLPDPLSFFERALWGVVYVGFLGAHLMLLHLLPEGNYWILVLTAITAGSDSGAYYFGRSLGKHKLCPLVSPNKTIEGAAGGLITGVIVAAFMALLLRMQVSLFFLVPVAIVLTGIGIVGDLTESIVKRATGAKDSGTLLAGHGGVLDRIDSLLFAAPVLYYLLVVYHYVFEVSR
jgi:phosphatidate cytidylyltransferase